jgi:hypothetical protein
MSQVGFYLSHDGLTSADLLSIYGGCDASQSRVTVLVFSSHLVKVLLLQFGFVNTCAKDCYHGNVKRQEMKPLLPTI